MGVNGSELIDNPWGTIFSPFTDILGSGFYLVPVTFIAIALYIKTKDLMVSSVWLLASGIFLSAGSIFTGYYSISMLYTVITAAGIVGVVMSLLFMRK